jgi:hypothetical protein
VHALVREFNILRDAVECASLDLYPVARGLVLALAGDVERRRGFVLTCCDTPEKVFEGHAIVG